MMNRLLLALLLPIVGCAAFEPPDSLERETEHLNSPAMEAAIKAAKPAEPR
jgi:hypothetical protein